MSVINVWEVFEIVGGFSYLFKEEVPKLVYPGINLHGVC